MRAAKKIIREESGQALVMTAVSLGVLLCFAGLATDVGVLLHERRTAQTAADSAAIGGAEEALLEGTPTTLSTGEWDAAVLDSGLNGFTAGSSSGTTSGGTTLTINIAPNITVAAYNHPGYVQAIVMQNTGDFFMRLLGFNSTNVSAMAIASDAINSNGCVYVMDDGNQDITDTVDMGGNSLITAAKCGVVVNGDIVMGGNSSIVAGFVAASGTITGGGNNLPADWSEGDPPPTDPLAKLQLTANQPDPTSFNASTHTCNFVNGVAPVTDLGPMSCVYDYNGGTLNGALPQNNTVYVFDESTGPNISSVSGTEVMLYIVGNIPVDFDQNGTLSLTPPAPVNANAGCTVDPNPYCGVVIDAPTDGYGHGAFTCKSGKGNNGGNPGELYFDFGSSTTNLNGVVYAPYAQFFTQDKGASATIDTDLVVGNICSQSSSITVNGFSGTQSPIARVGLVY